MLASWCRLDEGELIQSACRRIGFSDFGEWPFREGLRRLLDACADEAALSAFGSIGTRWDIARLLSNLLRFRYEEKRQPAILEERIERPLFITGLPRSGTTFLHQLLALDGANHAPRIWNTIHPYPELRSYRKQDRRRQRVARQLRIFGILSPDFRRMHPVEAGSPQECSEITAHVFASLRFDTTYTVPSYREWLDGAGHDHAYRFHKRFLQHLQYQEPGGSRWVLKCPDHIFALEAVRRVYPDARFVFVHRDPLRVLPSVARLTEVLRRPFTRHIDRLALGRQEFERWGQGAELLVRAGDDEPFEEPIFHVRYRELTANPLATVRSLYRHFGLPLEPDHAARMAQFVAAMPDGGYAVNNYRFDTYGIDLEAAHARFATYMDRFGLVREPDPPKQRHSAGPVAHANRPHPAVRS